MNNNRNSRWAMAIVLSLVACHLPVFTAAAQVGVWQAYMAYSDPQQIVKGGQTLYVRASNSLYSYNLNDHSITTYDKVNTLSDTYVSLIAWNASAARLIIVYDNSNIDLMDASDNVVNISALYSKSMTQDKTVNTIHISGNYAYLGTGFGIVKVNMQRSEIAESYILNENITAVGTSQTHIYARNKQGTVLVGELSKNLIDSHNWQTTANVPDGIFNTDLTDWNDYIETINTLQPGGPKNNSFGFMQFKGSTLYTCGGDIASTKPNTIQVLKDNEWTLYDEDIKEMTGLDKMGRIYSIDVDPNDENHVFAGARSGLYEFRGGQLAGFYNQDNSPIESALNPAKHDEYSQRNYNIITSVTFDDKGNLWCLNSQAPTSSLLQLDTRTGQWTKHYCPTLMRFSDDGIENKSLEWMKKMMMDSRGYLWFVNNYYYHPSAHWFYSDANDSVYMHSFYTFHNQNNATITFPSGVRCVVEDLNNDIWLGTSSGPLLLTQDQFEQEEPVFTQVVIPRNDGTNYADYLLEGTVISCMAIDAANRKWFGTSQNGVYVISADNMTQEYHFDTSNSPLLSDIILDIAIDNNTGCVYIATENGLCSYMSDATESSVEMKKDDVYAYPNPVVPGYDGLISVVGLAFNSDVKILTTNGKLVAQGRSNGGMFTWDGRDSQGRRVASGIYMVAAATSDGKKGVVCKIAIVR